MSVDVAAPLPHHCRHFHCYCCCNTQHYIDLQGWLLSWTVACTFFCSCCSTLLSPCLLCVSGAFLLLSVDNCTSLVEGDCFVNRVRRSPPDFQSTEVERQVADYNVAETRTTTESACNCSSKLHLWLVGCLVGWLLLVDQKWERTIKLRDWLHLEAKLYLVSPCVASCWLFELGWERDDAVTLPSLCFWPFLVTVRW